MYNLEIIKKKQNEEWINLRAKWWGNKQFDEIRTCYVFISSTFNDMHGERDYLTRSVFPELNDKLKFRGIRVVPVDLRWGYIILNNIINLN